MIFNAIDLLIGGVIGWIIYSGAKSGVVNGLYNAISVVITTIVTLHWYVSFGSFLAKLFYIPKSMQDFLSFVLLAVVVYLIFLLIREGWFVILRFDMDPDVNRVGGRIAAIVHSFFISGLIFLAALLLPSDFINKTARHSLSGFYFKNVSVSLYLTVYSGLIHRIFSHEPPNEKVVELVNQE